MERSMSVRKARLGRSNSSLVRSEYASSKCEKAIRYVRLSQSMKFSSESIELEGPDGAEYGSMEQGIAKADQRTTTNKSRARRLFDKMFSRKKIDISIYEDMKPGTTMEDAPNEKRSKKCNKNKDRQTSSSSWRPDPLMRWPVQGW